MIDQQFGIQPVVYVIESPGPIDVLEGRREGRALCSSLEMAGIGHRYLEVVNTEMLHQALRVVARDVLERRGNRSVHDPSDPSNPPIVPQLHFSAHGNQEGLCLTSGERVAWADFRSLLIQLCQETQLFGFKHIAETGLISVVLSSCRGAFAKHALTGPPYPCLGIVGPHEDVAWADALTAYVVFYHLSMLKDVQVPEAVQQMNAAAGVDGLFEYHLVDYVQAR